MYRIIISLCCLIIPLNFAHSQVPVKDKKHQRWSKVMEDVQKASQAINTRVTAFVGNIRDIQEFMSKAATIVNGVVKNLRMIRQIIEIEKDIAKLVNQAIDIINAPKDEDGDGVDDYSFLDKWKHIQILLAISAQAANVFDLFKNTIEKDATIMDDKGRLTIIKDAYKDALIIKRAITTQIRRINQEIYQFRKLDRERSIYKELFKVN